MNLIHRNWLKEQLHRLQLTLTGEVEKVRERPWATVYRVPTEKGDFYFKAQTSLLTNESRLLPYLVRHFPQWLPTLAGVDTEQGYLLLRSAGVSLRSLFQADKSLHYWEEILPRYATIQKQLIPHTSEILSLGVMNRNTDTLTEQFTELLGNRKAMFIGTSEGLTEEEYQEAIALLPTLKRQCQTLIGYGIPDTLNHDDFHDGNIHVQEGEYRFIDWGDSCISHPFFTVEITLRVVAYGLDCEESDARILALRDVYLQQWAEYAPLEVLRDAYGIARKVLGMNRALTWWYSCAGQESPYQVEEMLSVSRWVKQVLELAKE